MRWCTVTLSVLIWSLPIGASAQLTLSNGWHTLEIGGSVSMFYNHRILKKGEDDSKKNRFALRDAQLQLKGRVKNLVAYELQVDVADMAFNQNDPENPGLMEANIRYTGLRHFYIKAGYGKTPYGRSSLVPFKETVYWQRAEFLRGSVYSRRDVGVSVGGSFLRQLIDFEFGVYTGMGELTLRGDNDASGNPEFVGRVQLAWPTRYRLRDVDENDTYLPMFALGINGRYFDKTQPTGASLPAGSNGEFGIKVVNGSKYLIAVDGAFQWHGASAQVEWHMGEARLSNPGDVLLQGLPDSVTGSRIKFGALICHVNYHIRRIRTTLSARYEHYNLNDLATGHNERLGASVQFNVPRLPLMLRAQYWHVLNEETTVDPLKWTDQLRIGAIYLFE